MIKEFDLDAPMLPKNERSAFRYKTRGVTNLFERLLADRIDLGKAWKVLVEVVPQVELHQYRDLLGVIVVQVQGQSLDIFQGKSEIEQQEMAADWLMKGTRILAQQLKIDYAEFSMATDRMRALGYKNVTQWIKPKKSPAGKLKAEVLVELGVDEAKVIGRVSSKDGLSVDSVLFTEKPDEFMFSPALGKLHWVTDQLVKLESKDGKSSWLFGADHEPISRV